MIPPSEPIVRPLRPPSSRSRLTRLLEVEIGGVELSMQGLPILDHQAVVRRRTDEPVAGARLSDGRLGGVPVSPAGQSSHIALGVAQHPSDSPER